MPRPLTDTTPTPEIGRRLEALRESLGLSQVDFADLLGISRRSLQNYVQGNGAPTTHIYRILLGLGFSPLWILEGIGPMKLSPAEQAQLASPEPFCELIEVLEPGAAPPPPPPTTDRKVAVRIAIEVLQEYLDS